MNTITKNGYAKINLLLDVTGILPNGYHEVEMIMQTVEIHDTLTFTKRSDDKIIIEADDQSLPIGEDNLIYKAVRLLRDITGNHTGVSIYLQKNIPVAAGMAGGSADAAATLKGMNQLLELGLSMEELETAGVRIGADVPYCVRGKTALSQGIGEKLTSLKSPPDAVLVIAKPDINVSTASVYHKLDSKKDYCHPDLAGMMEAIESGNQEKMAEKLGNVLEVVTITDYPVIQKIKEVFLKNGALGALMSGSGPSVFGIFETKMAAQTAYDELAATHLAKQQFITGFFNGENE